jgi:pimeloyl-ACP methyl ester carboxylesterase
MKQLFCFLARWICLSFLLVLAGCVHYQVPDSSSSAVNFSHIAFIHEGQIEYYRFGKGSPIVLIPGYAVDVSSWDKHFLATLAKRHQVIVLNNRNVGRSKVESAHFASQDFANDDYQLIQKLRLKKPVIIGISMGGMIAQQYAVLHANKISQLILINTAIAGKQSVAPTPMVKQKMLAMPSNLLARYMVALELFFPPSSRMQMAYVLAANRFQPDDFVPINSALVIPQQKQLIHAWLQDDATAAKLHHITVPVLILSGTADTVIPPVNSYILARQFPNSTLVHVANGGHGMIFQFPVATANVINAFIATNKSEEF